MRGPRAVPPVVVMGVAGCGKTTVGTLLAHHLGVPYSEADSLHPAANVDKMARGTPLTDQDRRPWLDAVAAEIATSATGGLVVACSALKQRYRDVLRDADPRVWFLHLALDQHTADDRVSARAGHFMPASLVASQFEALEPLRGEAGLVVDATRPPQQVVAAALAALTGRATSAGPLQLGGVGR